MGAVVVPSVSQSSVSERKWARVHNKAHKAGMAALAKVRPAPIVVQKSLGLSSVPDPRAKQYVSSEGLCGFAWVEVSGRSGYGRWAKASGVGRHSEYFRCVMVHCHEGGQSFERKSAYVAAFAGVLAEAGVEAHVMSRMD